MACISYISVICSFLCSLVASAVALPWLLRFCHKHNLYDIPNERKMHKNNIPRLGGTIFLPGMVIGGGAAVLVANVLGDGFYEIRVSTIAMFVGTMAIYLTGFYDDVFGLSARIKFGIQFVAASVMPAFGLYVNNMQGVFGIYELPLLFAWPLTVFLILLVVNSINLIDGIDGLAAGLSMIALVALTALFGLVDIWGFSSICVSLIAALIVFLYHNIWGSCERHTKTFMGDSGSLILGYTLSFLGLKYAMDNSAVMPHQPYAVLAAFTVLIIPTFDLTRVAFTRLFQGKPIFDPDKQHIHHRFAAAGFTMHQTLVAILALQLCFCAMNAAMYCAGININIIMASDIILFTAVQLWLGKRMAMQQTLKKT